jgi:cell division GTPase FtsZ
MQKTNKLVFGLGGTGNNIVSLLANNYKDIIPDPNKQAYYINLSSTDISNAFKGKTCLIDIGGTGKDLNKGKEAVQNNSNKIHEFLRLASQNIDTKTEIIVISSLGGGSGSSLTPILLDYFLNIKVPLMYVGIRSSAQEGVTTLPNVVKNFQNLYNNYVLTNKLKCCVLFDNEFYEKKYSINMLNYGYINNHICDTLSKILDDTHAIKSSEGTKSLDYNEKKRVQFFGYGLLDFNVVECNLNDPISLDSSIFSGKYKYASTKAVSVLVKFRDKSNTVSPELEKYVDSVVTEIKSKFNNAFFVVGYNFENKIRTDIELNIISNGNDPSNILTSDVKRAVKSVDKIKTMKAEYTIDSNLDLDF